MFNIKPSATAYLQRQILTIAPGYQRALVRPLRIAVVFRLSNNGQFAIVLKRHLLGVQPTSLYRDRKQTDPIWYQRSCNLLKRGKGIEQVFEYIEIWRL